MKVSFSKGGFPKSGAVAFAMFEGDKAPLGFDGLAAEAQAAVTAAIKAAKFKGAKGKSVETPAPGGVGLSKAIVIGVGKKTDFDASGAEVFGAAAVARVLRGGETSLALILDGFTGAKVEPAEAAARAGYGARLRSYAFDKYRTKLPADKQATLQKTAVHTPEATAAKKLYADFDKICDGVFLTRDLVSEPPNVLHPPEFAKRCEALAELGLEVEVLGEKEMKKLGMGALLGVGFGSERESKLAVMRWNGGGAKDKPVLLVGKGVTFDTGGISIKPSAGMEEMKWDMGGAGAVTGAMAAIAGRKARANVIGIVGLVENMPDGKAQRPGDIVTSMSGQTIEILNTDAEGRLVLADALHYGIEKYKPAVVIDLATLTGAMVVSLGHEYAGMFSNDDDLAEQLRAAGEAESEGLWRMPIGEAYDKQIDSDVADMKNIGGRWGGSITAAQFLKRYVGETKWAHLDIAGTAWADKDRPTVPKGGAGFGVRLLDRFVRDNYEK